MRYRPIELEKCFKAYKSGDLDAVDAIFNSETERLFDYVMRMTGQLSRASETADEVIAVVGPVVDNEESLQDLLVVLYKTARNFAIEIWNADTSRLENSAYGTPIGLKSNKNSVVLIALEHVLRSLPPVQREILLLRERYGFSSDEVAEITGRGIGDVEEIFAQALGITESALPGEADRVPELMTKILSFPIPENSTMATQNLSMVFKDLKKSSRRTPGGWSKLIVGIMFFVFVAYFIWKYEIIFELLK